MRKLIYKKGRKVLPSLVEYTGKHKDEKSAMQLFVYDAHTLAEYHDIKLSQVDKYLDQSKTNWFNVHGLADIIISRFARSCSRESANKRYGLGQAITLRLLSLT